MEQRKLIIFGCLALLFTAGFLRWYSIGTVTTSTSRLSPNLLPDSVVTNLKQESFNAQGQLAYNLSAKHASQYDAKAIAELDALSVTLFADGLPDWHAQAQKGFTSNNGEIIELTGDVRIEQDPSIHENPTKLNTSSLTLSPKKEYAETQEPVTIQQGTSITHAIGMNVNTRAGKITLISNVKSRYETIP